MKKLEQDVFAVVQQLQPAAESVIQEALEQRGWQLHPEVLLGTLRRLAGAGYIARDDSNHWTVLTATPVSRPQLESPREEPSMAQEKTKTKTCSGCGKDKNIEEDFYRPEDAKCKRCILDRQKELKQAKAGGKKPSAAAAKPVAKSAAKSKAPPPTAGNGNSSVRPLLTRQYIVHLEDVEGKFHTITVDQGTVSRLAKELRAHE